MPDHAVVGIGAGSNPALVPECLEVRDVGYALAIEMDLVSVLATRRSICSSTHRSVPCFLSRKATPQQYAISWPLINVPIGSSRYIALTVLKSGEAEKNPHSQPNISIIDIIFIWA